MKSITSLIIFLGAMLIFSLANAQTIDVIGKVLAFKTYPVKKAEISLKGSKDVVYTDSLGVFKITCKEKDKLHVWANGFYSQVVEPRKFKDSVLVNLVFKNGGENIKIATGYNHIDADKLTYGIKHLGYENSKYEFYANIFEMLKSKVPGVSVIGETISVRKSTYGDSTPLIVLDGFVIGFDVFRYIDPTTVKSIDVLSDAASSARYGSRGMNGVIVITSKKSNN